MQIAGIEPPAGVQVVVHAVHAGGLQPRGLLGREQARRDADLQAVLGLDLRHDVHEHVEFPRAGLRGRR